MKILIAALVAATTLLAGPAHAAQNIDKLNGSIHVAAGEQVGDLRTVNGSIDLADGARAGDVHTVNGAIRAGNHALAASMTTVNGAIHLGEQAQVRGDLRAVNGAITVERGGEIDGGLSNVNGSIRLHDARVKGNIETTAGDIDIGAGSHVDGGLHVNRHNHGWFGGDFTPPRVVIGPGAVVHGPLQFDQPVQLYVSDSASVGAIHGATAKRFHGDHP